MIVLAATISPDLSSVLESPFGQPMAQVFPPPTHPIAPSQQRSHNHGLNPQIIHPLTPFPDLLRRPGQTRYPRSHVPPIHRPIPHGSLHHRRRKPPNLGLQPRWRAPLLHLLPPHFAALRLYPPSRDLGSCFPRHGARFAQSHCAGCGAGAVQFGGRGQQSCVGRAHSGEGGVGPEEVPPRAVLYGGEDECADCVGGDYVFGVWNCVEYVSGGRAGSDT